MLSSHHVAELLTDDNMTYPFHISARLRTAAAAAAAAAAAGCHA